MLNADANFGGWPDLDLLLRLLDALARVGGALGAEPAVRCVRAGDTGSFRTGRLVFWNTGIAVRNFPCWYFPHVKLNEFSILRN